MTTRVLLAGVLIGVVLTLVVGAATDQPRYQVGVTYDQDRSRVIIVTIDRAGNLAACQWPITTIVESSSGLRVPR